MGTTLLSFRLMLIASIAFVLRSHSETAKKIDHIQKKLDELNKENTKAIMAIGTKYYKIHAERADKLIQEIDKLINEL